MARTSAFRGTWQPNRRPYLVLTPDAYVSIQGETSVIACGECRREVDVNRYLTGIQVDTSVESPPGSATVTLSIPDNDINQFYADGELIIIPMMEIELYAKGYFTVGGFPQYYRIFWGLVSSVTKSWSNGVTTVSLNCRDILRWWEITNVVVNPAYLDIPKSGAGYQLFQNRFAGANPYTVIIALAKEAMGDFSISTSSFTSFRPEDGKEQQVIAQYAKDIMVYWQLKFGNIWNNLVLYGTSGQAYTFAGDPGNVSPLKIASDIFKEEAAQLNLNPETSLFKIQPHEIAAFKIDVSRAGDVDFFQNEIQSKLAIANTAKEQAGGYEFYCDTTGDIVFKPPFYNLNVLPNKPVSWIQDFEIMDDSITESEQEVVTHLTSSGNAFGGVTDWGLNDDITTPRTGVIDWHLLKRYGWRHLSLQLEWAGNPRKLFYHLLDHMDKVNARRHSMSVTIPMRPEIRMGFPVWIPKYDAFFYIQGLSHNYSPGGQATTSLTLVARRRKFIAPKNIGRISVTGSKTVTIKDQKTGKSEPVEEETFSISFPSDVGQTSGLTDAGHGDLYGGPAVLRDPRTGKLLGFPNAVMVYRTTLSGEKLAEILQGSGSKKSNKPMKQDKKSPEGPEATHARLIADTFIQLQSAQRAEIIDRLRIHRYETGMSNAGAYDYAHDTGARFKEFSVIPTDRILWGAGTDDPDAGTKAADGGTAGAETVADAKERKARIDAEAKALEAQLPELRTKVNETNKAYKQALKDLQKFKQIKGKVKGTPELEGQADVAVQQKEELVASAKTAFDDASKAYSDLQAQIKTVRANGGKIKKLAALNIMVRPVSDEFGFEVIGHYRYGRGAYIDRGQVQLPDPNSVGQNPNYVNELNVQFAAHGGLLTDPAAQNAPNLGPGSPNFAQAFEKMQPEDYMTGASFKGANYSDDQKLQEVNPTNQNTYSNSLKHSADKGTAVFAEADALRRAVTLAELKPTLSTGLDAAGFEKCACELGRTEWLSVLPLSFIQQVLSPVQVSAGDIEVNAADLESQLIATGEIPAAQETVTVAIGDNFRLENPGGFFNILHDYLVQRFNRDYRENKFREDYAVNGGMNVTVPDPGEQDNVLRPAKNSLFDRASMGDPDALEAMTKGANFNFGLTEKGLRDFKDTLDNPQPAPRQVSFPTLVNPSGSGTTG